MRQIATTYDSGRYADGQRAGRNITQHHSIGSDHGIVSDRNASEYLRSRTNIHAASELRRVKGSIETSIAQRHPLSDDTVVTNHRVTVDNDPALVLENNSSSKPARVWQFDSVNVSAVHVKNAVNTTKRRSQSLEPNTHSPIAKSMNCHCTETGSSPITSVSAIIFGKSGQQIHYTKGTVSNGRKAALWRTISKTNFDGISDFRSEIAHRPR
jgi:hypothetical protein